MRNIVEASRGDRVFVKAFRAPKNNLGAGGVDLFPFWFHRLGSFGCGHRRGAAARFVVPGVVRFYGRGIQARPSASALMSSINP
jgi:hypothetical protein